MLRILESHIVPTVGSAGPQDVAFSIAKITNHKGELDCYLTLPKDYDGTNIGAVNDHPSLNMARAHLGISVEPKKAHKQPVAKPKMRSLPQSTKGYKPEGGKGNKAK